MGQRANLAIVTVAPGYELYYTHWRAHTLDADLFWGPEAALPFARAQRSEAEGASWLDEVFAEGGAVIDTVRCELCWFGGMDVLYDVPLRRVHLRLMRAMWPGWTLRWADEGITDLVRALALPITTVLVPERATHDLPVLTPPDEAEWISGAISVRRASGALELHGLDALFGELARLGPRLLDALGPATAAPSLDLRACSFPTGGIHVDEALRRVEVWLAPDAADFEHRLQAAWPGWEVLWHRDRFEAQLERCEGRLVLPERSPSELADHVRRLVTRAPRDHRGVIERSLERIAPGAQVTVNAFARRDDPPPGPTDEQRERFERAVRALLGE